MFKKIFTLTLIALFSVSLFTLPVFAGYGGKDVVQTDLNPGKCIVSGQTNVTTAGTPVKLVRVTVTATTAALPACTYANGTAGVGATLTGNSNGALPAQDEVTLIATDRLLVKNQVSQLQNGVYSVTQVGTGALPFILTRATDYDQNAEIIKGSVISVLGGTVNTNLQFRQATLNPTIGTSSIVFNQLPVMLSVTVKAKRTNSGNIYTNDDAVTSTNGFILSAGEPVTYDTDNLADVSIDSSINGEGTSWTTLFK